MALSGREVLLVLRARDEATRTISRVSSAMRRMDRDAMAQSQAMITQHGQNLTAMRRQVHDISDAYRAQVYQLRALRNEGKINATQFRDGMLQAAQFRTQQMTDLRKATYATQDLMDAERARIFQLED